MDKSSSRFDLFLGGLLSIVGLVSGQLLGEWTNRASKEADSPKVVPKYTMIINLDRCIGCHSCTVVCKQQHHTPPSMNYNIVLQKETGAFPSTRRLFLPRPCMQCEKPPCVKVCPVAATKKREDGIVAIDYEKCIGCRYCMTACPYGARSYDFGDNYYPSHPVEQANFVEYGRKWQRGGGKSPINNVRKCHYCIDRITAGLQPACVETCVGKARHFGDANDPDSEVSKLLKSARIWRLKDNLGTRPQTLYIGTWEEETIG